jgi:uncharacterized protein
VMDAGAIVSTGIGVVVAALWGVLAWRWARRSLAHPEVFPSAPWGVRESVFTALMAGMFLALAALSAGGGSAVVTRASLETSLVFYAAIVLFTIGFLVFTNNDVPAMFGLGGAGWLRSMPTALWGLALFLPLIQAVQWAVYSVGGGETAPQPVVVFLLEHRGWRDLLAVSLVAIVAAPLTEELVFRGCVHGALRARFGRAAAIFASAVVFAVIHGHAASLPGLFLLAVCLSLLYEASGSLWVPVIAHAAFNAVGIVGTLIWPGAVP